MFRRYRLCLTPTPPHPWQLSLLCLEVLGLGGDKKIKLGVDVVWSVADLAPALLLRVKGY